MSEDCQKDTAANLPLGRTTARDWIEILVRPSPVVAAVLQSADIAHRRLTHTRPRLARGQAKAGVSSRQFRVPGMKDRLGRHAQLLTRGACTCRTLVRFIDWKGTTPSDTIEEYRSHRCGILVSRSSEWRLRATYLPSTQLRGVTALPWDCRCEKEETSIMIFLAENLSISQKALHRLMEERLSTIKPTVRRWGLNAHLSGQRIGAR